MENMGEEIDEYEGLYGYSIGETEFRFPIYEYPDYNYTCTKKITNIEV